MRYIIRRLTHWLYSHIVKPILFRHQPDTVHKDMIVLTKWVQKVPVLRELPRLWSYRNDSFLAQELFGIHFNNPVGLSAGFDKEISLVRMIKAVGFGWMTGGSVTWGQYKGNDGAWFYRLPKSKALVVNAGLPSEGTEVVADRVATYDEQLLANFPLSVSIAKTNTKTTVTEANAVKDYCASLVYFDKLAQVRLLEINISCPNTFGGEPFTTPARLEKLLSAADALSLQKPVIIKMPINLPLAEFELLLEVVIKHRVAGVAIGNLFKDRSAVQLKEVLPDAIKGNLSGAPTRDVTTELIRYTYKKYGGKLIVIGIGGIMTAEHAYEKIKAGASLVALITGLIYEGPQLGGEINRQLVKLLKHDGYNTIGEAVGKDTKPVS